MLKFVAPADADGTNMVLYYNGKPIKRMVEKATFNTAITEGLLYVGDINGYGLQDFKIAYPNNSSGLAGSLISKIYLFNLGHNQFQKISFMDFAWDSERDFNGDKNCEIFGQSYASYKNHGYWVIDLYSYKNGQLVNVGKRYNYPILIQFLYSKENFKITDKVPRKQMAEFRKALPREYHADPLPSIK